jgi:hypothetical protein
LSLYEIVKDIKSHVGSQTPFDAAIVVVKVLDYRASASEVIALRAIKNFFDNFSYNQVFCVITHCDVKKPDP